MASAPYILRDASHLFMEGTPPEVRLSEVVAALEGVEGVADVHHVHAWSLTSGRHVFSGHLRGRDDADGPRVLGRARTRLRDELGFFFVTLQVETACLDESAAEAIDVIRGGSPRAHEIGSST